MTKIPFTKMSGAGNDFIVIDNRDDKLHGDLTEFVKTACTRRISIGADGVLLLENHPDADFRMRYYNADGGEVEMCGNGARCIARFAFLNGAAGPTMTFESMAGRHRAEIIGEEVKVEMTPPHGLQLEFPLDINQRQLIAHFLNTGVPHVVLFTEDIDRVDMVGVGRPIRYHQMFQPAGTNANYVQVMDTHTLKLRTYERGVEDETLACGTGATAAAIIAGMLGNVKSPTTVITRSGIPLVIHYHLHDQEIRDVFLQGEARVVYQAEYLFE
ncbi:MAG: diaminopimelate epimerase [Gemmatimonadetes bacterium]|nr:MAG: diaminopimelate epimerase [Gemmatimonadota bacterium]